MRKVEERKAKAIMKFFLFLSLIVFIVNSWRWFGTAETPPPLSAAAVPPPGLPLAPTPPRPPPVRALVRPAPPPPDPSTTEITFADIRPIFEKYCFACHGGAEGQAADGRGAGGNRNKGGLSLATLAGATAGGRSRLPGIVPGNAAGSEIIRRVSLAPGDRQIMPQRGRSAPTLEEIQMVIDWVNAGAPAGPS
jgi:mono/diheme cytochrome c family protein